MVKPTSRILLALRRDLDGLGEGDEKQQLLAVLDEQAGLIVRLFKATERFTGEDDPQAMSGALYLGIREARALHENGENLSYSLSHLAILRAASCLGLRQSGSDFARRKDSADPFESFDDPDFMVQPGACLDDPMQIMEAFEVLAGLDQEAISRANALATIDAIDTTEAARRCGISDRAMRYRKKKARAAILRQGKGQGDLFGGVA